MTVYQTPLERQQMIERIRDRERLSSALGGARVMNIAPSTRDVDEAQLSSLPYLRKSPPIAGGTGSLYTPFPGGPPLTQEIFDRMENNLGIAGGVASRMMTEPVAKSTPRFFRGKGAFGAGRRGRRFPTDRGRGDIAQANRFGLEPAIAPFERASTFPLSGAGFGGGYDGGGFAADVMATQGNPFSTALFSPERQNEIKAALDSAPLGRGTLYDPFEDALMQQGIMTRGEKARFLSTDEGKRFQERFQNPLGQGIQSREDSLAGTGQMPVGNNIPSDQDPYATSVLQQQTGLDPLTKQLLFGLDGQGGFIPGAMKAAERTFFDEEGKPVVVPQEIAGFTPDQLRAQQLARDLVGVQSPYLQRSEDAYRTGISQLQSGLGEQERLAREATETFLGRLDETDRIQRGATDEFGRRLGDVEQLGGEVYDRFGRDISDVVGTAAGTVGRLGQRLGESGDLLRQTTGAFDPSMTEQFYDPYEERVVQQTISDALEAGDKADISQRARDIARGGESAFGSRARLGAEERREALGRGLGEALAGIRSRGFGQAQRAAMGEFGRQQQARRAAASGLAGLAGQQYGAGRDFTRTLGGAAGQRLAAGTGFGNLLSGIAGQQLGSQRQLATGLGQTAGQGFGARTGLGGTLGQIGAQRLGAQQGYGGFLSGLGSQAQQAGLTDINTLAGMGGQQQQLSQAQMDAIRANAMQAQQAPLAQYQALLPFIQSAPAGQFQTQTTFAPRPSPLQAGLATGLGTLGALGNFFGGTQRGGFGYAA
jgi:hypothetical protein